MAGINNIIGAYNINPRRLSSKLSFEVGQVFAAKIASVNESNNELLLKLLDGWQFPAMLESPLTAVPEGLVKFQVDGFEDGKLQLKIVKDKSENEEVSKSSIEDLINKSNNELNKEDYDTLKKMIKYNMPLTKENIAKVKTILDFKEKITDNTMEEDKFINKYLNNKSIDINSESGKDIYKTLKGFFNELKNISPDEILSMLESNIELNEENIKSFAKLTKEDSVIYKELSNVKSQILEDSSEEYSKISFKASSFGNSSDILPKEKIGENAANAKSGSSQSGTNTTINENSNDKIENESHKEIKTLNNNASIKNNESELSLAKIIERDLKNSVNLTPEEIESYENVKELFKDINEDSNAEKSSNTREKVSSDKIAKEEDSNPKVVGKIFKDVIKLDKKEFENLVKDNIKAKLDEMKSMVKTLIEESRSASSEDYSKVLQSIKEYANDFKVFNSISNQYYLIDVPINLSRDEYACKLLIKDDRKSGKKIDSKNINLVVSVKTISMGVIDAYLKVKNNNMTVDLKCDETYVKMFDSGKNKLLAELSNNKYNVYINVEKREKEATISNCSDFFNDNSLSSINIRV